MSDPMKEAVGVNGQMVLFPDKLVIKRKGVLGFLSQGMKGDKEIPIRNITAVQMKEAGSFTNGYLQLSLLGGVESRGGLNAAASDENTVMFTKKQEPDFTALKQMLDELAAKVHAAPAVAVQAPSAADELAKFAALRDQGIISVEEFEAKKRQILGL